VYGEHVEGFETVTASGFNQAIGPFGGEWGNLLAVYAWEVQGVRCVARD
jgi:hypothetical protein